MKYLEFKFVYSFIPRRLLGRPWCFLKYILYIRSETAADKVAAKANVPSTIPASAPGLKPTFGERIRDSAVAYYKSWWVLFQALKLCTPRLDGMIWHKSNANFLN